MTCDQAALDRVQALGYSVLQAKFLWLVALHSGVFLRRQYLQFAGISSGKHATEFLKKLVDSRHCRAFPLAGRIAVYQLDSKIIYRAIGHPDLRFRRPHGLDYVKTKVLSLDFILQNPGNTYLATEQEKVDYFVNQQSIPPSILPAKVYRPVDEGEDRNCPLFRGQVSVVSLPRRCGSLHFRERWRVLSLG